MRLTAACALALRDMAAGYDALAVSDWPALQADPGMHPGAAFSWIETADGMPIASEGDVLGAVTQIVARSLSGRTGALLDMTEPDLDSGRLLVWHGGGGPLHLADGAGAAWIAHPMIGRSDPTAPRFGAIADYVFAPGPVTLLRVSRDGGALFAMGGTVVAQDPSGFDGCRGWLADMSVGAEAAGVRDVVATVMGHGLEHHFVLIPGAHQPAALEFAAWTGMAPAAPARVPRPSGRRRLRLRQAVVEVEEDLVALHVIGLADQVPPGVLVPVQIVTQDRRSGQERRHPIRVQKPGDADHVPDHPGPPLGARQGEHPVQRVVDIQVM